MNYRLLPTEEYDKLIPIFGHLAPVPHLTYVAVAELDCEIIATLNMHPQLHIDHFWKANQAFMDWRKLWEILETRMPKLDGLRVYAAPTFKNGKRMCEIVGFHRPKVPVLIKDY